MKPFSLALLTAFLWGLAPLFEKASLSAASPLAVLTIRSLIVTVCLVGISFLVGVHREIILVDSRTLALVAAAGILGGVAGLFIYFTALKADLASRIVPLAGTYPLFAALFGMMILREGFSVGRIVGATLIAVGVFLVK